MIRQSSLSCIVSSPSLVGVTFLGLGLAASACTTGEHQNEIEFQVDDFAVVVSTESELLSRPVELQIDDSGNLLVLDGTTAQIHTLSPSGELLSTVGNAGSGPREFQYPTTFALDEDTVRVIDRGNFRLQILALDSDYQRSPALPDGAINGPATLREDGSMIVATSGLENTLAVYFDAAGDRVAAFGTPLVEVSGLLDPRAMKEELIAGTVPAFHRNAVLPVFDPSGGVWLVLKGERELRRYSMDGTLLTAAPVSSAEFDLIWNTAVEEARETIDDPRRVPQLSYVSDAEVMDSKIWLLLNMPETEPVVMLRLSADGTVDRRVEFENVHGAERFALNDARDRIFFTLPLSASVASASVPVGIF